MSVYSKIYENTMAEIRKSEEYKNKQTSHFLDTIFSSMVIGSFSYKGDLPKFMEQVPDYIEETIYYTGMIGYFEHEGEHYITLVTPCGRLLKNGMYSQYNCIFRNGEMVIKNIEDIEILYDNFKAIPPVVIVDELMGKCMDAIRAVDMALKRASTPDIYAGADWAKIGAIVDEINKAYTNQTPYAFINADWVSDELKKISIYDDEVNKIAELWEVFVQYKNLCLTTFGVNNVEISKAERLTKKESESNSEVIRYGLFNDRYQHRVDWLERIYRHFKKKIICEINRTADAVVELMASNEEKKKLYELQVAPYLQTEKTEKEEVENVDDKEDESNDGDSEQNTTR